MSDLPSLVAKVYNFPLGRSLNDICVAIVELGGGVSLSDIYSFCAKNGYLNPEIHIDCVGGAVPVLSGPTGADGEVMLDIEIIAAVAQGVKILIVFAPNTDAGFAQGIKAARTHSLKPCTISISWGAPISSWSDSGIKSMSQEILQAKLAKILTTVASGDNGSKDGTNAAVVDFPSSDPNSLACGGTRLTLDDKGNKLNETSWDLAQGNGSSGGGYTDLFVKPDYQKNISVSSGRCSPDVAGNADPVTGYPVIVDGVPITIGGTSAVAPLYAALCAIITSRLGQPVDNWHEILYSDQSVTVDVIGGGNGDYQCVEGYDLVTGLGTIDGEKLLQSLADSNGIKVLDPVPAKQNPPVPVLHISLWQKLLALWNQQFGRKPSFAKKHVTKA